MKIISFNVNGIRAIAQKSFFQDMLSVNADIICLQETKASVEQVVETLKPLTGFHVYANESVKKGYSGTAIITKTEPLSITFDMGMEEHDQEGRVTCAEFADFFLITVYVPNSGSELLRFGYRQKWDADFLNYLKELEVKKPIVVCGDKSAGFMQEEIDGMDAYHEAGLIDTFRRLNQSEVRYSWWSYRGGAREKNVGWRIDYFLVSENFLPNVKSSYILNEVFGSDHCPVGIEVI
jgi:exodeoxyribonuclease-3